MSKEKSLATMQKEVDSWAQQFKKPYFAPLSILAASIEELGEIARILNDMYGDKPKKSIDELSDLRKEVSDLIFNLICLANSEKIDLSVGWEEKMVKVNKRDIDRFEKK